MKFKQFKKGRLFVISAPSGSGKTTLCNKLLKTYPDIVKSISFTTRKPRCREKDGRDYYFIDKKEFEKSKNDDRFLEWTKVLKNYYATPKKPVKDVLSQGGNILLTIDVKGAMQVKKKYPKAVLIFILLSTVNELQKRLSKRNTESSEEVDKRLKLAKSELRFFKKYDYMVVNDKLDRAVSHLKAIIIAERCRIG